MGIVIPSFLIFAACLFTCQVILHPLWCRGGPKIARTVAGKPQERTLMIALAILTVLSVIYVLSKGGQP